MRTGKLKKVAFFVLLITIWELAFRLNIWPEYLFPSPEGVLVSLVNGFRDRSFIIGIYISVKRIVIGYSLSLITGIILGLLTGRIKLIEDTFGSIMLGLQSLPSIVWLPLAILWFGLSESAIIFVVVMGAILSITISTKDGVKNVPPLYLQAAQTLGAKGYKTYLDVIIPAAFPAIINGMKLGWSFAWRSLMAGELIFVSLGLGHLLQMGRELNDINQIVAVMVVIVATGLIVDRGLFFPLERSVRLKWGLEKP